MPYPKSLAEERFSHIFRLAARGFSRSIQIRLAEHNVSFGQWLFLRILWDHDGLSQKELSAKAGLTEPTTHTALGRLEAQGLLERRTLPQNRRKQHAFLTKRGHELRSVLEPLAIEINDVALEGLSDEQISNLREILLVVLSNLEADEERARAEGRGVPSTRISI